MIRNTRIKRALIECVFPMISFANKIVPKHEKDILIYCANDVLSDNSEALAQYLVANGYEKKYTIIIGGATNQEDFEFSFLNKVTFIPKSKCVQQYLRSKYVFYSFGKLPIIPAKNQVVFNMFHGIPLKNFGLTSNINNGKEFFFTHVLSVSEAFKPVMASGFGCPIENVYLCGEPKADKLHEGKNQRQRKLIVWTPTFRQSKFLGYDDSTYSNFLPMFSENEWGELEIELDRLDIDLVIKLHPYQDIGEFKEKIFEHLKIYSAVAFEEKCGNLYSFLSQADALLADYSSVGLEYLVLNRPIGYVIIDIEEYRSTRGFAFENPFEFMPGEKITNKELFYKFLNDVKKGNDPYYDERTRVRDMVHTFQDGENCKRILDISGLKM